MARRRQKQSIDPRTVFGLLVAIAAIWISVQLLQRPGIGIFVLAGGAAVLAYPVVRLLRRNVARRALLRNVHAIVGQQTTNLLRRRRQLVWQDVYGKPQLDKWEKEIGYFITNHIEPSLSPDQLSALGRERATVASLIAAHVASAMEVQHGFQTFAVDRTPAEFEAFCAEELRRVGWRTRVTMQTRDQGTDIVAEKGGVPVVLQCKLYSRPVGNKAVQEVAAARAREQASYGVVVTNSSYTAARGTARLHERNLSSSLW
jgi:restriction system protein